MYSIAIKRPVARRIITYALVTSVAGLLIVSPLFLSVPVYAVMLPTLLKVRTIGELIITLFAGAGTAITNPVILPQIYQAAPYTIEELVQEDILNLEEYPDYTNEEVIAELGSGKAFNLDTQGFRDLIESNWTAMREYQIDAALRFDEIANTDSVYGAIDNIGGIISDVAQYGYLGFENSIAIVANPLTSVKVSLENVKEAIYKVFGQNIKYGTPSNLIIPSNIVINEGEKVAYNTYGGYATGGKYYTIWTVIKDDTKTASYKASDYKYKTELIGTSPYTARVYVQRGNENGTIYNTNTGISTTPNSMYEYGGVGNYGIPDASKPIFDNIEDADRYLMSDNYIPEYTDLIGTEGNIADENIVTGINEGQGIDIIDSNTYNDFANEANENTDNGETEDNAILYDNLINQSTSDIPEPEPEPIIPAQPTTFPPRPTITPEQNIESLKGATPGITEFFPFCIPSDLVALFSQLNVTDREAPKLTWEWNIPGRGINETVEIDLKKYDNVASICRLLELILFIYGLIVGTRAIIGA